MHFLLPSREIALDTSAFDVRGIGKIGFSGIGKRRRRGREKPKLRA